MPCRHKGNKQALLSAASSIPHQRLCTITIPQLPHWKKKKEKLSATQKQLYENHVNFHWFYRDKCSFFPFAVTYCSAKISSLYFKVLALNGPSSCRTISHTDTEYQRTNDFQVLPLCVKNSTPRRAFFQTNTQELGLSTKGAPSCC